MIRFITGNKGKVEEVRTLLPEVEQQDIDLPEIQEVDPYEIVRAKLAEACKHASGEYMIEDTSLYFDAMNGLPGPLIKWFLKTMGTQGMADMLRVLGNNRAVAKTIIGYAKNPQEVYFFEGVLPGAIVSPRGDKDFGWGPMFLPDGSEKTFAEMEREEKVRFSMRALAVHKLKAFLAGSLESS